MYLEDFNLLEKEYFCSDNWMVLPKLLSRYFEEKAFAPLLHLTEKTLNWSVQSMFYKMMAYYELERRHEAMEIFSSYQGDWLSDLKQHRVHYRHVALFMMYFHYFSEPIPEYYLIQFENHWDDPVIGLLELIMSGCSPKNLPQTLPFKQVRKDHPQIRTLLKTKDISCTPARDDGEDLPFDGPYWNYYKEYNENLTTKDCYGMKKVYESDGLFIYSYKPGQLSASMHLLFDGSTSLILDCGATVTDHEKKQIPVQKILEKLELSHINGVLISHAHMDHYGSLDALSSFDKYMTKDTLSLISQTGGQISLLNTKAVAMGDQITIDDVNVSFVPNGHIRGSVLFDIDWKGKKHILYTGDFCMTDQNSVPGLNLASLNRKNQVDVLITETTFGKKKQCFSLKDNREALFFLTEKHLSFGNKLILVCSSYMEMASTAAMMSKRLAGTDHMAYLYGKDERIQNLYRTITGSSLDYKVFATGQMHSDLEEMLWCYDMIITTTDHFLTMEDLLSDFHDQSICVIKLGGGHKENLVLSSLKMQLEDGIRYEELPLNNHADYRELVKLIEVICPDDVIYVHGEGLEK